MPAFALPALPAAAAPPAAPPAAPKGGDAGGFAKALQQAGDRKQEPARDSAAANADDAAGDEASEPADEEHRTESAEAPAVGPPPQPWLDPARPPDWLAATAAGLTAAGHDAGDDADAGSAAAGPAPLAEPAGPRPPGRPIAGAPGRAAGGALADAGLPPSTAPDGGTAAAPTTDPTAPLPGGLATLATAAGPGPAGAGAAGAPAGPDAARLAPPLHSPGFAPALGAQLSLMVRDGLSEARLQLNPAEMGPVSVRISIEGTTARVDLVADHAQTRHVLEQAMPVLAGALRETGLTLTGGGVFEQPRDARQTGAGDDAQAQHDRPGSGGGAPGTGAAGGSAALEGDPLRVGSRLRGVVDLYA